MSMGSDLIGKKVTILAEIRLESFPSISSDLHIYTVVDFDEDKRFIKLTSDQTGKKIWVNLSSIHSITPNRDLDMSP